eukprot:UN20065
MIFEKVIARYSSILYAISLVLILGDFIIWYVLRRGGIKVSRRDVWLRTQSDRRCCFASRLRSRRLRNCGK